MRFSVPTIPASVANSEPRSLPSAVARIASFLVPGNTTVLTGAGVSVDSGIRAYRDKHGRYMNPNYKYHELMDETERGYTFRQRYWLRSYLGYPSVRDAFPNSTHSALAALQHRSYVTKLITQNVDGLHHKALANVWDDLHIQEAILELHGTLHSVRCRMGHTIDRDSFQELLSTANPRWRDFAAVLEQSEKQPRTNPDGDVALDGEPYDDFVVPDCPCCLQENRRNSIHKPEVIFFGESIPRDVKERSYQDVEHSDRLLVIGTTLATFSAFRLLQRAVELHMPVLLLNDGPTRADGVRGVEKIEITSGSVMKEVVNAVVGADVSEHFVVEKMQ